MERRKKPKWYSSPIVFMILTAITMIPINIFAVKVNNIFSAPENIKEIKEQSINRDDMIKVDITNLSKQVEETKNEVKDYKNNNSKDILRLEKAVSRLEALIDRISNYNSEDKKNYD